MAINVSSIFNNLKLARKLTLLLLLIFIVGITFSGIALANILNHRAEEEITSNAWLLIRTLDSVRSYTNADVTPQLQSRLKNDEFFPQVVPSFLTRKVFEQLKKSDNLYQDFIYKESMLNPTNLHDKADSFEASLVNKFRQNQNLQELTGFRFLNGKKVFYIARPLAITNPDCLKCHSTPDMAPKNMIKAYGAINGFGWKLNQINGIQIVSVPASEIFRNARQSLILVIGIIAIIFAVAIFTANLWLQRFIVRPIKQVAQVAEAVSTGDMDAEFEKVSNDEVGSLVEAFTRMKISLVMAMRRFEQHRNRSQKHDE
ncbi:MAG: DUF3365 domain-containing protein [Stigonema ocellatum SAG 48.90 = DSM 106950]|nr:DUF3365 domain-containing protein [Stigonema ocellatum SAG 48.90 = DSM 106950]